MSANTSIERLTSERDAAQRFPRDVAQHELTVLHDDGLYRHLRFAKPGTGCMAFAIVTWPGRLCFCGDMGTYVFERVTDMLEFFRHDAPNLGYWAEKCVSQDRSGVREYERECFIERARELVTEAASETEEATRAVVLELFEDHVIARADEEREARTALAEFDEHGVSFSDTWEYSFEEFTFRYAWCCHALVWAVKQYDAWKALEVRP